MFSCLFHSPWSGYCTEFKAGKDDQLATETEAVISKPSGNSRSFAPPCQIEVNWMLLSPLKPKLCCELSCFPKGPYLFLYLNQARSLYPQDGVVSELKWKVKTLHLTRLTEYGFWSQANWIDSLPLFFFFSYCLLLIGKFGKFPKISEVWYPYLWADIMIAFAFKAHCVG